MLWHAFRHADTPKWIKGFMLAVVVYLFSPIDLIPDFLVLFGITDDLVVITFHGHGETLVLGDGREHGFLVPADAPRRLLYG